jgi:HD-GYP domain-containing protein (c-di-GMP phosphodiesterase class II)
MQRWSVFLMSSDRQSDDPSPAADGPTEEASPATLVRERGAVLIENLDGHLKGAAAHAEATGEIAFAVAGALDFEPEHAELLREAAKLHEVGKMYVAAEALSKPDDDLDDEDRLVLALVAENGAGLVRGAGIPESVCEWILRWPERFDGDGPSGLKGDAIPLEARIINAACACAEVSGNASLPLPGPAAGVIGRAMRALGGKRLDPAVAEALATALG